MAMAVSIKPNPSLVARQVCLLRHKQITSHDGKVTMATATAAVAPDTKPFSAIPGPRGLPYLGTALNYRFGRIKKNRYHEAMKENYHKYGPIYKETIVGHTKVHLFHPDLINTIYQLEGEVPYTKPLVETTQMYRKAKDMSPGLGNTNGEEWYRLRSAVQKMMMRPTAVSMFLEGKMEVLDDFVARLHRIRDPNTGQVENLENEFLKWNLESATNTCFETRFGCLEAGPGSYQQKLLDANSDVLPLAFALRFGLPFYKYISTPTYKKLTAAEDLFYGHAQKMVDDTVVKMQDLVANGKLKEGQFGFLSYLIARDELSPKDVSILTISLFADGHTTTVPTLIGQLYCLAANPEKQQKLYEEIQRVAPNKDEPVTNAQLDKFQYLKACIKEGFRFFPIGTEVTRIPQKDIVIGGYEIPAGTHVELNNNLLLRLAEYFSEPEVYRPERWLRDSTAETVHPYLLLPFGFGPRMCIGRRFAQQELQIMLIRLLQNFTVSWPREDRMEQEYCILMRPDKPADFKFTPRE